MDTAMSDSPASATPSLLDTLNSSFSPGSSLPPDVRTSVAPAAIHTTLSNKSTSTVTSLRDVISRLFVSSSKEPSTVSPTSGPLMNHTSADNNINSYDSLSTYVSPEENNTLTQNATSLGLPDISNTVKLQTKDVSIPFEDASTSDIGSTVVTWNNTRLVPTFATNSDTSSAELPPRSESLTVGLLAEDDTSLVQQVSEFIKESAVSEHSNIPNGASGTARPAVATSTTDVFQTTQLSRQTHSSGFTEAVFRTNVTHGVSSHATDGVSSHVTEGVSSHATDGVSSHVTEGVSSDVTEAVSRTVPAAVPPDHFPDVDRRTLSSTDVSSVFKDIFGKGKETVVSSTPSSSHDGALTNISGNVSSFNSVNDSNVTQPSYNTLGDNTNNNNNVTSYFTTAINDAYNMSSTNNTTAAAAGDLGSVERDGLYDAIVEQVNNVSNNNATTAVGDLAFEGGKNGLYEAITTAAADVSSGGREGLYNVMLEQFNNVSNATATAAGVLASGGKEGLYERINDTLNNVSNFTTTAAGNLSSKGHSGLYDLLTTAAGDLVSEGGNRLYDGILDQFNATTAATAGVGGRDVVSEGNNGLFGDGGLYGVIIEHFDTGSSSSSGGNGGGRSSSSSSSDDDGGVLVAKAVTLALLAVLGVGGNALVIWSVVRQRHLHRPPFYYLLSLSLTDLSRAAFCLPLVLMTLLQGSVWRHGGSACDLFAFANSFFVLSSGVSLLDVAADRHLSLVYPRTYRRRAGGAVNLVVVLLGWTLAFLVAFPPVVGVGAYAFEASEGQCTLRHKFFRHDNDTLGFLMVFTGLALLTLFLYYRVFLALRSHRKMKPLEHEPARSATWTFVGPGANGQAFINWVNGFGGTHAVGAQHLPNFPRNPPRPNMARVVSLHVVRNQHVTRLFFLMTLVFHALWLPYQVLSYWRVFGAAQEIGEGFVTAAAWLSYAQVTVCPLVYLSSKGGWARRRASRADLSPDDKQEFLLESLHRKK